MKIRYTLELDDLVAFNQFYIDTSPSIRKQRLMLVIASILLLTLSLLCWRYEDSLFSGSFGIFGVFFIAYYWYGCRKVNAKRVAGLYPKEKNPGMLCQHELEILPDGFIDRTHVGEGKTTFRGIVRIESTATHSFVFIGTLSAHVIPHAKVTEGHAESFVTTLKQKWETQQLPAGDLKRLET